MPFPGQAGEHDGAVAVRDMCQNIGHTGVNKKGFDRDLAGRALLTVRN